MYNIGVAFEILEDGKTAPAGYPVDYPVDFHQSDLSVSITRLKTPPRHRHVPPVQNNQPGTGFGYRGSCHPTRLNFMDCL